MARLSLGLSAKRGRRQKYYLKAMGLSLLLSLMFLTVYPFTAWAAGIGDVVTDVSNNNFSSVEFNFGNEKVTGLGIKMHMGGGSFGQGYGGITVLGPADAGQMKTMLEYVDSETQHTSIQTRKLKGCEVREYTMEDGSGVGVILPDYFLTVELYETGNSSAADIQTAVKIAQQTLDGLERAGLLSQAAPDIATPTIEPDEPDITAPEAAIVTGKPLDEPIQVSNTNNISGVSNGPTAPTTFTVNSPHLITLITNYHWNNARGAAPGTISLQSSDGKIYGPWKATTRPGQGGVPNAYWDVQPNIVVPPGTYTIIDSDSATWSQNSASGGRGMGEVRATPHFEVTSGKVKDLPPGAAASSAKDGGAQGASPAGVGSVANIPGPSNTTEAVVGVAVPGLLATALGALGSLGGGIVPPAGGTPLSPTGSGPLPGAGGIPRTGSQTTGMVSMTSPIGRRGKDELFIDTEDMSEGAVPVQADGIIIDTLHDKDLITDGLAEGGIIIDTLHDNDLITDELPKGEIIIDTLHDKDLITDSDPLIDPADEAGIFVGPGSDILIDDIHEEPSVIPKSDVLIDGSDSEILIDTTALSDKASSKTDTIMPGEKSAAEASSGPEEAALTDEKVPYDREGYNAQGFDRDGFDRDGFNAEGFDQEGFNKEGFDKNGYNEEGFNQAGFDAEGYDKEGFNQAGRDREGYNRDGFDREGFNKEGFDKKGYDKEGFNKAGFDAEGYDKEGFNQTGRDREGFNRQGFDQAGFDREGFNKEGFDKNGYNKEGFNKAGFDAQGYDKEGFNQAGLDREGFNRQGFDQAGFDREGFNKEGFDKNGYDKEGFNKAGFDAQGYDKEGFNQAGFDAEGYGRNGYDAEGYNRDGFDVNGYDRNGRNSSGYDAEGYNAAGFDRDGFNKAGLDKDGFDREGFNQAGYDRDGFDKNGFDRDGYDREGFNKEGRQRDGTDEYGYGKDGFNKDGYDQDGYDLEGFDYKGYNRDGFDPWGYDRQGYDKSGYHWSGYNADGYDRNGKHWSDLGYDPNNRNPFDGGPVSLDGSPIEDAAPKQPPLGQPYPKTAEKYGPKAWTDEIPKPESKKPMAPTTEETGVIGPEDPMNTLKNHGVGETTEVAPEGQTGTGLPVPEADTPTPGTGATPPITGPQPGDTPPDSGVIGPEDPMNTLKNHDLGPTTEVTPDDQTGTGLPIPEADTPTPETGATPPAAGPQHGDTITLPGKDGRDYVLDYNAKTGEWENILTGGKIRNEDLDSYVKDFNKWQDQVADDQKWSAADLEKMGKRQDANSQAIDEALGKWKNLENMQKTADKYGIGEKGGPGDMDKAIQDLKDDMLAGRDIDENRMEQLKKIIGNRIQGKTTADTGQRWEEEPWYKDVDSAGRATVETAREVVTGEDSEGNTSWLGMGARVAIGAATGGATEGIFTVAEAMHRIKTSVDSGKDGVEAFTGAIKQLVLEEIGGDLAGGALGKVGKIVADTFPNLTKEAAELVERNMLKIMKADQLASRGLGLVGAESAEKAIKQIEKRLTELGRDAAAEAAEKAVKAAKKTAAGASDDAAGVAGKAAKKGATEAGDEAAKKASRSTDDIAGKSQKTPAGSSKEATDRPHTTDAAAGKPGSNATGDGTAGSAGAGKKSAGAVDEAAEAKGKLTQGPHVSTKTPGLEINNSSFKDAGQPPDLRGMPARDQKAVQMVSDRYGVKAQMRPTNPEAKKWLETGKAHPKPEMLKTKTINEYDVELGYPKEYSGTVACKKPAPLPAAKPEGMSSEHWQELQKRHKQRLTEYTDQVEKLNHLEQEGKIFWDKNTGVIYNSQSMKPYAGDHDAFAFVDAVTGEPVSPLVNQRINRELQSLGATQHPEHVGWDYSGLSDKVPDGAPPGAQSPQQIAEGIDQKILKGHDEGGQPLNTYNPLQGSKGGWSTSYWKGGVRQ